MDFFTGPKCVPLPSNVTVTTRTVSVRRTAPPTRSSSVTSRSSSFRLSSSPSSSSIVSPSPTLSPAPQKRKSTSVEKEELSPLPGAVKRLRPTPIRSQGKGRRKASPSSKVSSRASSRQNTLPPSPEPLYRSSCSRSTSHLPHDAEEQEGICRKWYTEEDGDPGMNPHSSELVVKRLMKKYKPYFRNPRDPSDKSFEDSPTNYPVAELEYPNDNARERFMLLAPRDKDHYNPIMDLERSLYTIVEYYLTNEQRELFGPIPSASLSEAISPPASPILGPSRSHSPTPSSCSDLSLSLDSDDVEYVPPPNLTIEDLPLLRTVQRAIETQDGPLFLVAMERVNKLLRSFKSQAGPAPDSLPRNTMMDTLKSWRTLPEPLMMRIIEENYQRTVGPQVPLLKRYEAFSSTVYGELMPSLASEIIKKSKLTEDKLFLDLGSGVGNVVVQASLQSGCKSYGIELMPHPARVATDVVNQIKIRSRMWGVTVGEMELQQGDMLKSTRVDELISQADVVLVDNKVFEESLNAALRPKFLDLKEGAMVISLVPFVNSINARITWRNVDDMTAIFDVREVPYHSGSVSWGNNGGCYYIHTVDRKGYAEIKGKFESTQRVSTRTTRSRK
ncbi:S-adenosyl-L-methionine-dependent methyltransferase [Panaeolus papilionaceus]|nr:S-adenosyl-L-methionine-dependent methyltransferase [Panaeolus papilionaceus]